VEVWAGAFLVAVLESEAAVRDLAPDLAQLKSLGAEARNGPGNVCVCALAQDGAPYDVVSRFFAPGFGIPEDPATGSAHCILSPLFSDKLGRDELRFNQAYPGRGGDIMTRTIGPRVVLVGQAITVMESRLRLGGPRESRG
jgi:predicted PhzF superfamily epimerase YddE/YHI9